MKNKILIIVIMILTFSSLVSCTQSKVKADTPLNATLLLSHSLGAKDYDLFKDLFNDTIDESRINDIYEEVLDKYSSESGHDSYGVIRYDNGEILLVNLVPHKIDGTFKVQDIQVVPDELKDFFNREK